MTPPIHSTPPEHTHWNEPDRETLDADEYRETPERVPVEEDVVLHHDFPRRRGVWMPQEQYDALEATAAERDSLTRKLQEAESFLRAALGRCDELKAERDRLARELHLREASLTSMVKKVERAHETLREIRDAKVRVPERAVSYFQVLARERLENP